MTDDDGPITAADERYRRDLDKNVVGIVLDENLVVIRLRLANIAQSPTLNAESGLAEDPDVCVADLHPERGKHVGLIVLDGSEAPVG